MIQFLDFHSHHPSKQGEWVLQHGVHTWGIHPWHVDVVDGSIDEALAVGECGLDRCCDTPLELQTEAFRRCILESEKRCLPLVLHCVRAIDDCLALRRELHAVQPWIWHGYRGKATQLQQLLPHGFYFSFGFQYNAEALHACPLDRMLLESDENPQPISTLYNKVADELGMSIDALSSQLRDNAQRLLNCSFN